MVRAWHPEVVPFLDDNRLPGMHLEMHMILSALEKARRERPTHGWFFHPETQCFVDHDGWVSWLHDLTVVEMQERGYNHRTPVQALAEEIEPEAWRGLPGYKSSWRSWLFRDLSDLALKWRTEGRFRDDGTVKLGRRYVSQFGQPRFANSRSSRPQPEWLSRDYLEKVEVKVGHEQYSRGRVQRREAESWLDRWHGSLSGTAGMSAGAAGTRRG